MSLEGNLRDSEMADVLQLIASGRRAGVMTVRSDRDQSEAFLYCKDGQIVHATWGDRQAEPVVLDLLGLHEGSVQATVAARTSPPPTPPFHRGEMPAEGCRGQRNHSARTCPQLLLSTR